MEHGNRPQTHRNLVRGVELYRLHDDLLAHAYQRLLPLRRRPLPAPVPRGDGPTRTTEDHAHEMAS